MMDFQAVTCLATIALVIGLAKGLPTWNVVADNLLTIELGVAFPTETVGYVAGDANGAGPEILKSTDGGHTFTPCNASFGADFVLYAAAAAEKTIVVTGVFGELYSDDDGNSFHFALGGGHSQSARYLGVNGDGGHSFGCAGFYQGQTGAAISHDGGKVYKTFTSDIFFTFGRYGAYPTDDIWYIAAGEFPSENATQAVRPDLPPRFRKTAFMGADGRFPLSWNATAARERLNDQGDYKAQIGKTTDGGKTWTSLFAENGTVYFNGIDCTPSNPNHCCAVAEAISGPANGAYIYCTFDGKNFNRTFSAPVAADHGYSLIDIRFANDTFAWACGGILGIAAPKAWFLYTTDGGHTWDAETHVLPGYYALGLSVVNDRVAYAAIDNIITQASGVAKYFKL